MSVACEVQHPRTSVARGVHPSGVGVRRYRRWSDLGPSEQDDLTTQSALSLLNFLDPVIIGIFDSIDIGKTRWMAHVRHMPTAFGSTINLDVFFATGLVNLFASVQNGFNRSGYFPGLDVELHRFPLRTLGPAWLGAKVGLWFQPVDQKFETTTVAPGALASARLGWDLTKAIAPFIEVEAKSSGFVAGNPSLGPAFAVRTGLAAWIH